MKLRLGYALELVLVIAVAMALARASFMMNRDFSGPPAPVWWDAWWRFCFAFEPFLSGVALAGGAGLAIESLWRRSPPAWGWGRWIWSLACLGVLINFTGYVVKLAIYLLRGQITIDQSGLLRPLITVWPEMYSGMILLTLVPTWMTARFAGLSLAPSPDGREWTGRVFGMLSVLWAVIFQLLPRFS